MNISKILSMAFIIAGIALAFGMPSSIVNAASIISSPTSNNGVVPQIIDGANNGGNRTCSEVGQAYFNDADYFEFSSDRVNAANISTGFPTGLNVTSDGTYVSFNSTFAIGAAIVKGSNEANTYVYNPQSNGDSNLASPPNASGNPARLSNITFCWNNEQACQETVTCPTSAACRVDQTLNLDCGGTIFCEGNAPAVESCPARCGQQASEVPDGQCGYTQCPATEECESPQVVCNDTCRNDTKCENIGPGYICYHPGAGDPSKGDPGHCRLATNPDSMQCEEPTPTPTPTPTPPTENLKSDLSVVDASCDSDQVKAFHKIKINDLDHEGMGIVFKYNGIEQKFYTGSNGEAVAFFTYTGDGYLDSIPDGLPGISHYVTKETDCSAVGGVVLGTSTEGQVLGAYAQTGIAEDVMMFVLGLAGAGMFTTGTVLHVKNRA